MVTVFGTCRANYARDTYDDGATMLTNDDFKADGTARVLDAVFDVYNCHGWGFLEVVNRRSMVHALRKAGVRIETEVATTVFYDGEAVGEYRADLVVDGKLIVELKAVDRIAPEHRAQVINYLKASGLEVGLLLNFGPKPEFKRLVLFSDRKKSS